MDQEEVLSCRSAVGRRWLLAAGAAACTFMTSCAPLPRLNAVPSQDASDVTVLGLSDIRYWGDEDSPGLIQEGQAAYARELSAYRRAGHAGPLPPVNYLAISGGGEDRAFGAGLLVGWTASGTRPQFKLVTGISTGALTPPFAFLGPRYDAQLQAVYTRISSKDVLEPRFYIAALTEDALASNRPLRQTQGVGDIYRIYVAAQRDKIDCNLAIIPETSITELQQPFDTHYMYALFALGNELGKNGYHWAKFPPGYHDLGVGPTLSQG